VLDIDLGEGGYSAIAADKKFSEVRLVDISSMIDE